MNKLESNISIDQLIVDAKKMELARLNYFTSYNSFVQFFDKGVPLTKDDIILGINFVYGWMPTIVKIQEATLDKSVVILNASKKNLKIPDDAELAILVKTFNGSLVGTSKLLHFILPEVAPIWDSRVYRYLFKAEPNHHRLSKIDNYRQYVAHCKDLKAVPRFEELKAIVSDKIEKATSSKIDISNIRVLELVMFMGGRKHI